MQVSGWANKKRSPNPNTVIRKSSKTTGKKTHCAEGPRLGTNLAAAPTSRAHVDPQGKPYKNNGKRASRTRGHACGNDQ